MTTESKIMDHGTLTASTDSWLLVGEHVKPLHIPFDFDTTMEGKMVSVIGKMGMPEGSSESKLIVEKIVLHADIAARAEEIHQSGAGGSAEDNWLRAERELLSV
jgi:hypothetical protein